MSFLSRFFFFFFVWLFDFCSNFFFPQNSTHFLPVCACARLLLAPECLSELSLCQLQINKAISQLVRPYNQWRMPSPPSMHFVHRLFQGQSTLPARRQSHSRVFAASIVKKKKKLKNAANKHSEASCQDPSCATWATRFQARRCRRLEARPSRALLDAHYGLLVFMKNHSCGWLALSVYEFNDPPVDLCGDGQRRL